jgi:hypothetical protein
MFLFKTSKGNEYDEKSKKLLSANLLFFLSPRTLSLFILYLSYSLEPTSVSISQLTSSLS